MNKTNLYFEEDVLLPEKPSKVIRLLLMVLFICLFGNVMSAANRYSVATGLWSATSTWSATSGGASGASVPAIGDVVTIEGGFTVTVSAANTSALNSLIISSGSTLTTSGNTTVSATTITVNGTYNNGSTGTITATNWTVSATGIYNHNTTATAFPLGTTTTNWNIASNFNINGFTGNANTSNFIGQSFGNVTYNCSGQTGAVDLGSANGTVTVKGNFSVVSTGTGILNFRLSGSGNTPIYTINGNFSISGGTLDLNNSGGTNVVVNMAGNYNQTGGTLTETTTGASVTFNFNKTGTQIFSKTGGTITSTTTTGSGILFNVVSGSTLDMGISVLDGTNKTTFTLSSGAGLITANSAGITASGATGSIQVASTRTYSTGASYTYNGTSAQVVGSGLPVTVSNLNINNSVGVTLGQATTITNNFSITTGSIANLGVYMHTAGTLTLGGSATASGSWGSTTSAAINKNNTFFSAVTGIVNVLTATCTAPTLYSMTGAGGSFCGTSVGSSVGLANSQVGVSYQLLRGSVAVGSPIAGTGSAISFGAFNTTGTYTVLATTTSSLCMATMTGTVNMLNYSTPPTPTATVVNVSCPTDATGTITITNSIAPASLAFVSASKQYIDFGMTLLSNRAAFTVEGWIKFDPANYITRMALFGQNDAIEIAFEGNYLRCWTSGGGQVDLPLASFPAGNAWHHIAVTGDGTAGGLKIYLDGGTPVTGGTATANYGSSSDSSKIGYGVMDPVGSGVALTGEVFKLGFWNRALSAAEITNMSSGFVVYDASQSGLLAGYSFNEGAGTTVSGVGSVAPTGTFVNSPVWKDPYVYSWTSTPAGFISSSKNLTGLTTRTYNLTSSLKGCTSTGSWVVNSINSTPVIITQPTSPTATCSGSGTQTISVVAAGSGLTYSWRKGGITLANGSVISGQGTATLILTNPALANAGSYDVIVGGTCSPAVTSSVVTVTIISGAPSSLIVTTTLPSCSSANGTITVTTPAPSLGIITYTVTGTAPVVAGITNATGSFSGLSAGTYNVTASNPCGTSIVTTIDLTLVKKTWGGSAWSPVGNPTADQNIEFAGNYSAATDVVACSCTVTSGTVTIPTGNTLKLGGILTVSGGSLTFENNASLLQTSFTGANSGSITYKRQTTINRNTDFTYWSSPVAGQTLYNTSPLTLTGQYYSFNSIANSWSREASSKVMVAGVGYIIRGSETHKAPNPAATDLAVFNGVPNNGTINVPIVFTDPTGTSNLIGNPYPSAIYADKFLAANSTYIDGTLYFWTHNTAIQLATAIVTPATAGTGAYAYTSDDYASYNGVGGVSAIKATSGVSGTNNANIPSGKIAAGDSFFTTGISNGNVTFTNDMRVDNSGVTLDNSQFFKTSNTKAKTASTTSIVEKDRIWLDLTNSKGAFKQTLVGYVTDATNGYDSRFDGESLNGNDYIDFYSVNLNKNLTIQGRALPFDENDTVPLGFSSTIDGDFSINIDQVDGLLTNQTVFLEDKLTNTITDLKSGNYTFTTVAGTFNDRLVLHYTNKNLGTNTFIPNENKVLVSVKNKQIKVNSFAETIDKVTVYDLLGRQIYQKINVNSNELYIADFAVSHQALVVKTTLQNGKTVSDKIIY